GNRLGRGGGYYDRLLSNTNSFSAGLAFDIQIVENIPREAHDCQVDAVFTSTSIFLKG
ncbi:MAG: 5-formyltetrahydrofolate cyclo-ligase, partial [Clostridiales bacterium]|nr:5-formyltetrahydrofolate cyclo-ligase [Clostridiales bacterium]